MRDRNIKKKQNPDDEVPDNAKFSFRLPHTFAIAKEVLAISEFSFNKCCWAFLMKKMPRRHILDEAKVSRSVMLALYRFINKRYSNYFKNIYMSSLCDRYGKRFKFPEEQKSFFEEDFNMDFNEKLNCALNRRSIRKRKTISSGKAFNVKKANGVGFEDIPADVSIKHLIFKVLYWYDPNTQSYIDMKRRLLKDLKRRVSRYEPPDVKLLQELVAYFEKKASEENSRERREWSDMHHEDYLSGEIRAAEKAKKIRQERKQAKAKRKAEDDAFFEKQRKAAFKKRLSQTLKVTPKVREFYYADRLRGKFENALRSARSAIESRRQAVENERLRSLEIRMARKRKRPIQEPFSAEKKQDVKTFRNYKYIDRKKDKDYWIEIDAEQKFTYYGWIQDMIKEIANEELDLEYARVAEEAERRRLAREAESAERKKARPAKTEAPKLNEHDKHIAQLKKSRDKIISKIMNGDRTSFFAQRSSESFSKKLENVKEVLGDDYNSLDKEVVWKCILWSEWAKSTQKEEYFDLL